MAVVRRFSAALERQPGALGWTVARIPFDIHKTWKTMVRLRVKVGVSGEIFRTSVFPDVVHGGHFILVNKKMQKASSASLGDSVEFSIEPDLDERETAMPKELSGLLKQSKALVRWYGTLGPAMQREIGKYIEGVNGAEARIRRAENMAERLMLTMEGETVLPPIIEAAFRGRPAAREGWKQMTTAQRRRHLLGVFYYQGPDARERRVKKLVEDALRIAKR